MWILLWIVLSAFVLGIFFWSTAILQQQKKAWSAVAIKLNLKYESASFTTPPIVSGFIKNHKITFFTDSQVASDARGQRFLTAIEIELGAGMPTTAAIATKDYAALLQPLRVTQSYTPVVEGWNAENIVKTQDRDILTRYLTPERLKVLQTLFSMKNAATLYFFDTEDAVLRIQTPDPLRDADRMEKIARRILAAADVLALTEQERNQKPAVLTPAAAVPPAVAVDTGPATPIILPDADTDAAPPQTSAEIPK